MLHRTAPALALAGVTALIAASVAPAVASELGQGDMDRENMSRSSHVFQVTQVAATDALQPIEDPLPPPPLSELQVGVESLAEGFTSPTNSAVAPGDPDALYVSDKVGPLWRVDVRNGSKQMVVDLSGLLVPVGLDIEGEEHPIPDERGFLGVAFHPDFERNGLVYTYASEPVDSGEPSFPSTMPSGERADHLSVLREWTVQTSDGGMPSIDPNSSRVLFRIAQPQWNHNGGELLFGPDGMLYVQLGDGGGADDQNEQMWWIDPDGDGTYAVGPIAGHVDGGNAQDLGVPLGKILRIDVNGRGAAHGDYGIPADNPFVDVDGALAEIWAYGLRNPFQGSIDRETGDHWVGDVGQNDVEEVDVIEGGGNYGWNVREGTFWFAPRDVEQGSGTVVEEAAQPVPPELVDPVAQYDHDFGVAVIGGYVYRGLDQPALEGQYVFGDHDGGKLLVRSPEGSAHQLRIAGHENDELGYGLYSFAEDAHGELYVMGVAHHGPAGQAGRIERIVPAGGTMPRGGVDAGFGGTAGDDITGLAIAALTSVLLAAGGGVMLRRRHSG